MLLNPPFSCRGGTRHSVETRHGVLTASTAMSFLILATEYLAERGDIACVLPANCVHSQKDIEAWKYFKARYNVRIFSNCAKGTFPDSAASTVLVRLSSGSSVKSTSMELPTPQYPPVAFRVRMVRGNCPIHRGVQERDKPTLVHYTDIRNGTVLLNGRRGFGSYRCVNGPAILIPRVGTVTVGKVAILDNDVRVMLSDCVIALKPEDKRQTDDLKKKLMANFEGFRGTYVGTGAPFTTMDRLRWFLLRNGIDAVTGG